MSGIKILCVEDNRKVQTFNQFQFAENGYAVDTAYTLAEARESLRRETPRLIILDINMPDGDGRDFLKELRAFGASVPVLILTGYGEDKDVVAGFESGCNDYLSKPYSFQVLLLRTKELLKRAELSSGVVENGGLTLDKTLNRAYWNGVDLVLTQKEFALLLLFVQNEGKVMDAEQIYEKVWNAPLGHDRRALRRQISTLRSKLLSRRCGYDINTVHRVGYCLRNVQM
jgi:DNA-binding response OmpR family regulator